MHIRRALVATILSAMLLGVPVAYPSDPVPLTARAHDDLDETSGRWIPRGVQRRVALIGVVVSNQHELGMCRDEVAPERAGHRVVADVGAGGPPWVMPVRKDALRGMSGEVVLEPQLLGRAHVLGEWVQERFHCVEYWIAEAGPIIGTHTGPGIAGLCWYREEDARA